VAVYSYAIKRRCTPAYADEAYSWSRPGCRELPEHQKKSSTAPVSAARGHHPVTDSSPEPQLRLCLRAGRDKIIGHPLTCCVDGQQGRRRREMVRRRRPVVPGYDKYITAFTAKEISPRKSAIRLLSTRPGRRRHRHAHCEQGSELARQSNHGKDAKNAFGLSEIYIEKYIASPRHIGYKFLATRSEISSTSAKRESALSAPHQKLIEESPSGLS